MLLEIGLGEDMKPYIQIVLLIAFFSVVLLPTNSMAAETCLGFQLPASAQEVSENRYTVPRGWDVVMKFYKKAFRDEKHIKKTKSVSLPQVRVVHYDNMSAKKAWAGANVSLINGRVYIYCYERNAD